MLARKKRNMIIIITSIIITVMVIIAVFAGLYLKTDMFKPKSKLFIKYASQNIENIKNILSANQKTIEEEIKQNKFKTQTEAKVEYKDNEKEENSINKARIDAEGLLNEQEKYRYEKIKLKYEEEEINKLEYIKNNEICGIKLDGIKQFISFKKENSENTEQNTENEEGTKIKEALLFSENEKEILTSTYLSIINQNTSKENYKREKNKNITLNGKTISANAYSLNINKENYNNIIIKILERASKDEIILGKIDKLQENLEKINMPNEKTLREEFIEYIENKIENIKNINIGQEKIELIVYERNGITIKTELKTPTYEISTELYDNKEAIKLSLIKIFDNKTKETTVDIKNKISENSEEKKLEYIEVDDQIEKKRFKIDISRNKEENIHTLFNILYKVEENEVNISIKEDLTRVDNLEKDKELENNNIVINELEKEKAEIIKKAVENNITSQTQKILEKIKLSDINYMLKRLEILKESEINFEKDDKDIVTEAERNRFNSKLTFYIGKEINTETLKQLLETISGDTKNIQVIFEEKNDKKQLKGFMIDVKRNTGNEKQKQEMLKILEENKNEKFTVAMSYEQETKLINKITIVSNKFIKK